LAYASRIARSNLAMTLASIGSSSFVPGLLEPSYHGSARL